MDKIENQKFIIERFDGLYDTVNNKGNFLISFQSLLIGVVLLGNRKLDDFIKDKCWHLPFNFLSLLLILAALISIFNLIRAVFPYTKSGKKTNYKSLIFFGTIKEFESAEKYHDKIQSTDDSEFLKDLTYQSFQLADGLTYKFKKLSEAMIYIYFELIILLLMLLIILFK